MGDYNFSADLLNKFLQLTPWVQVFIGLEVCVIILGFFYFFNQAINAVMKPFCIQRDNRSKEEIRAKTAQHLTMPGQLKPGSIIIFLSISFQPARL